MVNEFKSFWNSDRQEKADELGLKPVEVIILASIVEEETLKSKEKATIAGVYLNRLKKGWRLQADPTIRFAMQDFDRQRIYEKHMQYESPYNTYRHKGLPPGPICLPAIETIDAVLNAQKHSYMYFCAKEDRSGYHNFAQTLRQHNIYARKLQQELNRRRIK